MNTVPTHTATIHEQSSVLEWRNETRTIVWADRWHATCLACGQPIPTQVDTCPVGLNMLRVEPRDAMHGCGEWIGADYEVLPGDATDDQIDDARAELTKRAGSARIEARAKLRETLRAELGAWLAQPTDRRSEPTGSDQHPGIWNSGYTDMPTWEIWAWGPSGAGDDIVVVTAAEVLGLGLADGRRPVPGHRGHMVATPIDDDGQ